MIHIVKLNLHKLWTKEHNLMYTVCRDTTSTVVSSTERSFKLLATNVKKYQDNENPSLDDAVSKKQIVGQ